MSNLSFWTKQWETGTTRWNLSGPHPFMSELLKLIAKSSEYYKSIENVTVYVPGCGHGHDAAFFAEHGFNVIAVDFVEKACEIAKTLYGSIERLSIQLKDVLLVEPNEEKFF